MEPLTRYLRIWLASARYSLTRATMFRGDLIIWSTVEEFIAWSPKVHGMLGTDRSSVFFDKAWIEK